MAFNVAYQPSYGLAGSLAYQSGSRSREDELGLKYTQIALQQLQQDKQIEAQRMAQMANERMAIFGAMNNRQNLMDRAAIDESSQRRAMGFQARSQNDRDRMLLDRDRQQQSMLFDRQMKLQQQEMLDRSALQQSEFNYRDKSQTAKDISDASSMIAELTEKVGGLDLSDEGSAWWTQRLKELERVDESSDLNDSQRAVAYRQWLGRASAATSPRYSKPKEIDTTEWLDKHTVAPGTYLYFDPDGKPSLLKGYDRRAGTLSIDETGRRFRYNTEGVPDYIDPTPLEEYKAISTIASDIQKDGIVVNGFKEPMQWDAAYQQAEMKYRSLRNTRESQSPTFGRPDALWQQPTPEAQRSLFENHPRAYLSSVPELESITNASMGFESIPAQRAKSMLSSITTDLQTIRRLYPTNDMISDEEVRKFVEHLVRVAPMLAQMANSATQ